MDVKGGIFAGEHKLQGSESKMPRELCHPKRTNANSSRDHVSRNFLVRFQVLTAANMKNTIFRVVEPCTPVKFTDVSEVIAFSDIRKITI